MTDIGAAAALALFLLWGLPALLVLRDATRSLTEESRRWRRLIQLYFEKQVNAPLPVDADPDEPVASSVHLPADVLEEIERQEEEEAALRERPLS